MAIQNKNEGNPEAFDVRHEYGGIVGPFSRSSLKSERFCKWFIVIKKKNRKKAFLNYPFHDHQFVSHTLEYTNAVYRSVEPYRMIDGTYYWLMARLFSTQKFFFHFTKLLKVIRRRTYFSCYARNSFFSINKTRVSFGFPFSYNNLYLITSWARGLFKCRAQEPRDASMWGCDRAVVLLPLHPIMCVSDWILHLIFCIKLCNPVYLHERQLPHPSQFFLPLAPLAVEFQLCRTLEANKLINYTSSSRL